jgi:hypothetical protein
MLLCVHACGLREGLAGRPSALEGGRFARHLLVRGDTCVTFVNSLPLQECAAEGRKPWSSASSLVTLIWRAVDKAMQQQLARIKQEVRHKLCCIGPPGLMDGRGGSEVGIRPWRGGRRDRGGGGAGIWRAVDRDMQQQLARIKKEVRRGWGDMWAGRGSATGVTKIGGRGHSRRYHP